MGNLGNPVAPAAVLVLAVLSITLEVGAEPGSGFQTERRVRESTRLDWEFAAGAGGKLPAGYDSRQQRYQLFVPPTYKAAKTWPLVVFISPGDDPLGCAPAQAVRGRRLVLRRRLRGRQLLFASTTGAGRPRRTR